MAVHFLAQRLGLFTASLLMMGLLLFSTALAQDDLPLPDIELSLDPVRNTVWVENRMPGPYTFRFDFHGFENAAVDCENPCLKVVPGYSRLDLLHFRPIEPMAQWHFDYRYVSWLGDYRSKPQDVVYRLPYPTGKRFKVIQGYHGSFSHQDSYALDFLMPEGTPIHAARPGTVAWVVDYFRSGGIGEAFYGRENQVIVLHSDGSFARYLHLRPKGVAVRLGQLVKAGELLGWSGNTGYSSRPHLHFDVMRNQAGERVVTIPTRFVSAQGIGWLKEGQTY